MISTLFNLGLLASLDPHSSLLSASAGNDFAQWSSTTHPAAVVLGGSFTCESMATL
ncbi:hypothetical protein PF008_g22485 [Phytophthora fragariae]|uniref:Uncharacterized protein n=1 Tax=Phytophthora fragariae TaxID=53985 RepID=A0A6G0QTI7_9STRA|nr:hypothetical protein PF008_g22485 [Phytophthora fragariae]